VELVIELVQPQKFGIDEDNGKDVLKQAGNTDIWIEPMSEKRRGRWLKGQMTSDWADGNKMAKAAPEELPGYHVSIDVRGRKVRVFDPLYGTQKGEDIARRFEGIGQELRLERPKEFNGLSDTQLWGWLLWAYRVVAGDLAQIVSGEFPKSVPPRWEQERQWHLDWYPDSGKRKHWEPLPPLNEEGGPAPRQPSKNAA
jgi:hypothetical protein